MSFFSVLGWAGPQVKLYVPAGRYFLEQLACRPMSDGDMDEKIGISMTYVVSQLSARPQ